MNRYVNDDTIELRVDCLKTIPCDSLNSLVDIIHDHKARY